MKEDNEQDIIQANILEIHYWFDDNSHSMDAYIQNKCEYEILAIIKEVASLLSLEVIVETEPFGEGGLKKWLKAISKAENKKGTITTTILVALISVLLITPLSKGMEKVIDKLFEDTEMNDLQKEKLKQEIERLKQENALGIMTVDHSTLIKKRKSNFYNTLEKYPKVDKVSFTVLNEHKERKTVKKQ